MPTYTYTPNKPVESNKNNNSTILMDKNIRPTIELDELSIKQSKAKNESYKPEDTLGVQYPMIRINEYIFSKEEIINMTIDSNSFLPKITLVVSCIGSKFINSELPKDGDIISVFIQTGNDVLKPIRNDYVITSVFGGEGTSNMSAKSITLYGELFIPYLKSAKLSHSFVGTSYECLQDIAKKLGLGFASNETGTDDKQIWFNGTQKFNKYIETVVTHAWKDDNSFFSCWIDVFYNLNFVNVNKMLLRPEEKIDYAVSIGSVTGTEETNINKSTDNIRPSYKIFTNAPSAKSTGFYIKNWKPKNKASAITFRAGSKLHSQFYVHNNNYYNDSNKKICNDITLEPLYDEKKTKTHILLRGRSTSNPKYTKDGFNQANYSYPEIYVNYTWMGIQDTISNPDDDVMKWDGNHHRNYYLAKSFNWLNLLELDKLNIDIEVTHLNSNVIKGDKLPIIILFNNLFESSQTKNVELDPNRIINSFYSGWYYVKGFTIEYDKNAQKGVFNGFSQTITLTRREWVTPQPITSLNEKESDLN